MTEISLVTMEIFINGLSLHNSIIITLGYGPSTKSHDTPYSPQNRIDMLDSANLSAVGFCWGSCWILGILGYGTQIQAQAPVTLNESQGGDPLKGSSAINNDTSFEILAVRFP
jgi:hypothetical protein